MKLKYLVSAGQTSSVLLVLSRLPAIKLSTLGLKRGPAGQMRFEYIGLFQVGRGRSTIAYLGTSKYF